MDINYLLNYINPLILGFCLLTGYALKEAFDRFPNKYIPLTALCMGTLISILLNYRTGLTAENILGGMISGLASTGLYEMVRNLIKKDTKKKESEE